MLTPAEHIDAHRLDCPACVAADDCAANATARLERDRADAARWRKVEPLIAALRSLLAATESTQ